MAQTTLTLEFVRPDWLHTFDFSRLTPAQMLGFEALCARDEIFVCETDDARAGVAAVRLEPSPALLALVPELACFGVVRQAAGCAA